VQLFRALAVRELISKSKIKQLAAAVTSLLDEMPAVSGQFQGAK
jgi:hypothetical protein